jgi:small redox-active disulfide protein 2
MMEIKVYGRGCPKCKILEENARKAADELKLNPTIEKVSDIDRIIDAGIMTTPALEIDGKIVSSGRVMTAEEIKRFLK